ncbi:hypothetical protein J7L13_02525 [bacterium]|nr:hypothetical protein [bacterium]
MAMKEWLKFSFWFNPQPAPDFPFKKPLLWLGVGGIVASLLCLTILAFAFQNSRAWSSLREQIFYFLFLTSFSWLLAWFFRDQSIPYLSAPVVFLVIGVGAVGWLVWLIVFFFRRFLPLYRQEKDWQRKQKYLPQPKQK